MGHTNTTPNYNLPQFLGSDKPAWLTDVNNAMSAIDTAIASAKAAADNAGGAAAALATTVGGHTTQLETLSNTVANQGASIVSQGNAINNISSLIGNGTPTTTDRTIIGGINEINGILTANGKRLAFAYDAANDEYGFMVDGQFYPLAGGTPSKWDAVENQSLLVGVGKSPYTAPDVVNGTGTFTIKTKGDGTAQNGVVWVDQPATETVSVQINGTMSGLAGSTAAKLVKHSVKVGDDEMCTKLADINNGAVTGTYTLNAGEYFGIWMANNAAPTTELTLAVTVLHEV